MIHQFTHMFAQPRYWVDESEGRKTVLGRVEDTNQLLPYQKYRFAHRSIARNTDKRTLIGTVLPSNIFYGHSLNASGNSLQKEELLFTTALLNSFVVDFSLRQRVTANLTMFFIYQLPVPRLTAQSPAFSPIVDRAAKLICTTPEFDNLAAEVGLGSSENGVIDPDERAALRAELDGLVAHLYGLTKEEFAYILTTFPLVDETTKTAALTAFNQLAPEPEVVDGISQLIAAGESEGLEFKSTARVNLHTGAADKKMEEVILKTVAGFWNAAGGTLLIGVADGGAVLGLAADLATLGRKNNLDGLELFLTDLLLSQRLSLSGLVRMSFHDVQGKSVCKIAVEAAPGPVWVTVSGVERLFVRTGNATHSLAGGEAYSYARRRWG